MSTNNAIIGTAGHVDHGKTLLIKALTGMETDRLAEEKKRGITIELGFAYLTLQNGEKAGIVDVPGHEKFVRNMLAGAGSIDLAMLVVAADEGIMPQTREHLTILKTLDIKRGLVALNKVDLVDEDWLAMVTLDIEEELRGSFLEIAPILPVSAYSGQGVDALRQTIFDMLAQSPPKKLDTPFRLPIDRVFTMGGFGTVVTGTLIEGRLALGQDVTVYPSGLATKARRIHVHGDETDIAVAGQRVAVNLAGLKVSDITKGDLAAQPQSLENSRLLDVAIEIDTNCLREIRHNSRLHLYHGTADMLCSLTLFDKDMLTGGDRAYAQLRLASPLAAKHGDHFVLRFYSPVETVGGGIILDATAKRAKREPEAAKRLETKENGSLNERILTIFAERSSDFPNIEQIKQRYFQDEDYDNALSQLAAEGLLIVADSMALHISYVNELGKRVRNILTKYHKENPLHEGIALAELCTRILPHVSRGTAESALQCLVQMGLVRRNGQTVANADFVAKANDGHKKIADKILSIYEEARFAPPSLDEMTTNFDREKKVFAQVFESLIKSGDIIALTPQIHVRRETYDEAMLLFEGLAIAKNEVLLADFRDAINTSRKYALAFLEHFDKKNITKKVGEGRILLSKKINS
ncbi:MAG: selenocysteine-specific translation elongation factor [Defluviitaleaceae bacterium]|nr:selenocysteine-specific translation elongation factor [Defluviitaleaceae bacterium]